MRESIITIPITEVFEPKCGCPICSMRKILEKRTVEFIMGAAMMEPDVRIATNKKGFCKEHYDMMLKEKNRLSLALMLQTHLDEVRNSVFSKKKLFEQKDSKNKKLEDINNSCYVCEKIDYYMENQYKTLFEVYQNGDFHKLFLEQEYICLPHCKILKDKAQKYLPKNKIKEFQDDCDTLTVNYLNKLYDDVSHYCKMYDYRNTGADADWGNSRDSIERAINFLTAK